MKRKWLGAFMAAALTAGTLAGCSGGESTSKEGGSGGQGTEGHITFWAPFSGPDGPRMKEIVDSYNQSQEEYSVDFQIVPQSEYYKTVDLGFSGQKNNADLLIMHGDQIPTYVDKNLLKDVTEITAEAEITREDYSQTAWEGGQINGKQYGIPLDIHPLMFYWNKDMFKAAGLDPEKPPVNREEFVQMAKQLTNASSGQYGFVVPTLWPQQFIFPTVVAQNGGELIKDGKVNYNSPEAVEALSFLRGLVAEEKVSPENVQQDGEVTLFLQGKNAMHLNGPWMMEQWETAKLNYGVAPVPQLGTEQQAVFGNSHNFVIPASLEDEKKIAAAQDFLKYVAGNAMEWAKSGMAPASKAVYESEEFNEMKQQPQVAKQFEYAVFSPRISNWGQVSEPLWSEVNLALLGQKDPQKALDDAVKKAEQRME
ncbi:ABC transporter substrate-binding protein [Mesobacillus campisalis]|nr:ABC transporter substrate-binding protein [Mesobacillus campisalis]